MLVSFLFGEAETGDRVLNGGRGKGQANMKGAATSVVAGTAAKKNETSKRHVCLLFRPDSHTHVHAMHVFFPCVFLFRPFFFAGGPFISGRAEKQGQDQELENFQTHGPGEWQIDAHGTHQWGW